MDQSATTQASRTEQVKCCRKPPCFLFQQTKWPQRLIWIFSKYRLYSQPCDGPPSRLYVLLIVLVRNIGLTDVTKTAVYLRQPHCSTLKACCLLCLFRTAFSTHRHPAHPVSVPIRHPRDELCSHHLRDRQIYIYTASTATRYQEHTPYTHACGVWVSWSMATEFLAFSSRQFAHTINHQPLSTSYNIYLYYPFVKKYTLKRRP